MKKKMFRICVFSIVLSSLLCVMFSQEALLSDAEKYYQFLSLEGETKRPTLNYRTLSDSVWAIDENALINPWKDINLGRKIYLSDDISMRVYGPELYMSFNTAAPYGQNDGVLWQGKGFNASLLGGVRFELFGIEATLKPNVTFSQNLAFDIIAQSYYDSEYGYFWGYGKNTGVDAPQRFGANAFFDFSWGDSEIRYTWKTLTIGFGTQSPWIGPAQINPILHSNNAPPYPKIDIGIRRQPVTLFGWYAGDIEGRIWTGYLSESDYFDSNQSNNHNMINAFAFAYEPSFLPGLTLFANRLFLTKWDVKNLKYLLELFFISLENEEQIQGKEDQKASFGFNYYLPQAGVEFYAEIGIDDYVPGKLGYIRYPFHTMVYTAGFKKTVSMFPEKQLYGELLFELTSLEMSQDFQFQWPYNFYFHHVASQGHTNKGQWLGAGNGTGGNSQYLGFTVYYPQGKSQLYIHRSNPDNNYLYKNAINDSATGGQLEKDYFTSWKASLAIGITSLYFITDNLHINAGLVYNLILNPLYKNNHFAHDVKMNNFRFELGIKYQI